MNKIEWKWRGEFWKVLSIWILFTFFCSLSSVDSLKNKKLNYLKECKWNSKYLNLVHLPYITRLSESGNSFCYYFPGFTANLASFFILRECGKYNIIFYIFNNVYPWLIRVAQDYQGWSSICCLLVHLFTSVFWGHGNFSENRLPMALRPDVAWGYVQVRWTQKKGKW